MLQTTAQRFGSTGKSFVSPSAAAAVIGAALLASDTSDTSETAWSPAAACLLPDVLPVAGTLLSYGGDRQLAAGGTVTHSGALNLGANALTVGAITASGNLLVNAAYTSSVPQSILRGTAGVAAYRLQTSDTGSANTDGFGIELSTTTAYLWNYENASLVLGTNNTTCLTLAASGAATFAGAITASGDIGLALSKNLFLSNGLTTGNYITSGNTVVFGSNTTAQGGWNSSGMYARRLFIDYTNADICLARASASNLGIYAADGSTPAAITCGAITASGNLSVSGVIIAPLGMIASANNAAGVQVSATSLIPATGNGFGYNDNAADLGIAVSRWRDLNIGRNAVVGGNITASGTVTANNFTSTSTVTGIGGFQLSSSGLTIGYGHFFRDTDGQVYLRGATIGSNFTAPSGDLNLQGGDVGGYLGTYVHGGATKIRGGNAASATSSGGNGGAVWIHGGAKVNTGADGNVVVCHTGSAARGRLLVGTATDDGSTMLQVAGGVTASGAIQETPTQSALDPTTTNIPSGKRMGWYNSTLSEFRDWVNIGGTLLKSAAYT